MKKYLFLILTLFIAESLYSQGKILPVHLNAFVDYSNNASDCFITYKIPYNRLVFKKNDLGYFSGITLNLEIKNDSIRAYYNSVIQNIFVNEYEKTKSKENYFEGFLTVSLSSGNYILKSNLSFNFIKSQISLPDIPISINKDSTGNSVPLLVDEIKEKIEGDGFNKLLNFGKIIPFSRSKKMFVLPVKDSTVSQVSYSLFQKKKLLFSDTVKSFEKFNAELFVKKDKLFSRILSSTNSSKMFLVKNIEKYFDEGAASLVVKYGNNKTQIYKFNVVWLNKPLVLRNVKFSISVLEKIWNKKDADTLLDLDKDKQYFALKKYFKKYDRNKSTIFNEIMSEFYSRVDYSILNFGKNVELNNALSDMGRKYIMYGKPNSRERIYSKKNHIMEIWKYDSPKRKFVFIDNDGLGDYTLVK